MANKRHDENVLQSHQRQARLIVSQEELVELTGYSRPAEIAACLARQGVSCMAGKRGRIFTTVTSLDAAMGLTQSAQPEEEVQVLRIK